MTLTRTQAGKTPKKTEHPGYVETPGTYKRRSRKSKTIDDSDAPDSTGAEDNNTVEVDSAATKKTGRRKSAKVSNEDGTEAAHTNGHANGSAVKKQSEEKPRVIDGWVVGSDPRVDITGHKEFGGAYGTSAMMIGFPLLMYYMLLGAEQYGGYPPTPARGQSYSQFFSHLKDLVYTHAYPHRKAWLMYWVFFVAEGTLYCLAPGVWAKGKPLPHANNLQLDYYCSGLWSWWITIAVALAAHFANIFRLETIVEEFGPLMSVAIISGFGVSLVAYISALYRGKQHRMTGSHIYDFFMGAELNPRMFGILDFKMFFEVRLPWYMMFLMSLGVCARQYDQYGYVSGNLALLTMAYFLYANACAKGEQCIVPTWDMYFEKWGFMLIFWNLAGVPFTYCHALVYVANHPPAEYEWNRYAMGALFVAYLFVYWVWDTTNSQKNNYRYQEMGGYIDRKAFPVLPYRTVKDPKIIKTPNGGTILADGWYGKARKIHYTCDLFFALSWGAVTSFKSPFPWFYPLFFGCMIVHRAIRDIEKCRSRYGEAWAEYERQVPYLFIPYVI